MPRPIDKVHLLAESQKEFESLDEFLSGLELDEATRPGTLGEWSVKDVLAHLYEWQQMFFRWYEAGLRGEKPAVPAEGYKWSQLPALNQKIFESYRDCPLHEIAELLRTSHQKTMALVKTLPGETLTTPGLYPWMNQNTLIAYLAANTSSHYHWARTEMRKGLKKRRENGG